jgi:hypothetical protein
MNCEQVTVSLLWPISSTTRHLSRETEDIHNRFQLEADIRTMYCRNTNEEHCHYTSMLDTTSRTVVEVYRDAVSFVIVGKLCVPRRSDKFRFFRVKNGSGAHPASYSMSTGSSFPGGKAAEA